MKLSEIQEWAGAYGLFPEYYGRDISGDIYLVLMGETHNVPDFVKQQEEFISLFRPKYLLHELFKRGGTYFPSRKKIVLRQGGCIEVGPEFKKNYICKWADEYGVSATIDIDVTIEEYEKIAKRILAENPDYDLTYISPRECEERENIMGHLIVPFSLKAKRQGELALGIAGAYHIKLNSTVHPILQSAGLEYVCIDLTQNSCE